MPVKKYFSSSKKPQFIPTSEPVLDGNEKKYVLDALKTNWISAEGPYTKKFEEKFAKYVNTTYATVCSNGTAALHLALVALGIGPGDEVIIPDFTIICSASMTILAGARPVLVDVDKYWCLDPTKIEAKITKKTKAIMAVHMYGNPADMIEINKIAKKYNLFVIEDACAAHGAQVNGKLVGSMGDIGCFSFYASKNITTGEGGMVVTNNKKLAEKIKLFKSHAFEKPRFIHRYLGFNYRLTDIQAAVGLAQLENITNKVTKRRSIASYYSKLLKNVPEVTIPQDPPWGKSTFWMYGILINNSFGKTRDEVISLMAQKNVGTERFYTPMSQQPVFIQEKDSRYPNILGSYPLSQNVGKRGLYLPSGLGVTKKQQEYVVEQLLSLIKK